MNYSTEISSQKVVTKKLNYLQIHCNLKKFIKGEHFILKICLFISMINHFFLISENICALAFFISLLSLLCTGLTCLSSIFLHPLLNAWSNAQNFLVCTAFLFCSSILCFSYQFKKLTLRTLFCILQREYLICWQFLHYIALIQSCE